MNVETGPEGEPIVKADESDRLARFERESVQANMSCVKSATMSNFAPDVNPRLAHLAVTGRDSKDEPKLAAEQREREKMKSKHVREAIEHRQAELKADMEIGRRVADSLHDHAFRTKLQADLASNVLTEALQREQDYFVQFVDVSGSEPRQAAKRVSVLKEQHPEWEIEPIDVTGALEETTPHEEINIEGIHPVMAVRKHIEDPPDEIRFAVPNVDLPMDAALDPSDLEFDIIRYVNLERMPEELRNVVRAYLSATRGTMTGGFKHFKKRVVELVEKMDELPSNEDEIVIKAKKDVEEAESPWPEYAKDRWQHLAFMKPCHGREDL